MGENGGGNVVRLSSRGPGEDPEDPYDDVDLDELPDWWRQAIRDFRDAGLRPYRPPRFEDGRLTPDVIEELEDELDLEIRFSCFDGRYGDDWDVEVDGDPVGRVGRHRSTDGRTVYELTSQSFVELVRSSVSD